MITTRNSYKVLGFVATVMVALLVLGACGGGDDEPEPTATARPATATSVPATATATTPPSDGNGDGTGDGSGGGGGGSMSVELEDVQLSEAFTGGEEAQGTEQIIEMAAMGDSGQSGTTRLVQISRTSKIEITLSPPGDGKQIAFIGRGRCDDAERDEQMDYILFDVVDGKSISIVNTPPALFAFNRLIVIVLNGNSLDSGEAACGNI